MHQTRVDTEEHQRPLTRSQREELDASRESRKYYVDVLARESPREVETSSSSWALQKHSTLLKLASYSTTPETLCHQPAANSRANCKLVKWALCYASRGVSLPSSLALRTTGRKLFTHLPRNFTFTTARLRSNKFHGFSCHGRSIRGVNYYWPPLEICV